MSDGLNGVDEYDALLLVSFGGPEGMDDVIPFLENVLRGRNVPRERMLQVAHHYELFDGVSPINQQNRNLIAALRRSWRETGRDFRSTGAIATGIRCLRTQSVAWPRTESRMRLRL